MSLVVSVTEYMFTKLILFLLRVSQFIIPITVENTLQFLVLLVAQPFSPFPDVKLQSLL